VVGGLDGGDTYEVRECEQQKSCGFGGCETHFWGSFDGRRGDRKIIVRMRYGSDVQRD
jgi:hypothetical protein